jgi:hypothetical protein
VSEVAIDEEIVIEGTFGAPRKEMLASPRVIVRTDVVRAFAAKFPGFRRLEQPGVYQVDMRIPPHLLAPQSYWADFRMLVRTPEGQRLVPGVRVSFSAYDPSGEKVGREGVVRPSFEWTIQDEHGAEPPEHRIEDEPLDPDDGLPGEA